MVLTQEEREEENEQLIKFICHLCETSEQPLNLKEVVVEFIAKEKSKRAEKTLAAVLHNYKYKEVFEVKNREKRVRQFFGLGIKINDTILAELKEHAEVKLDGSGHIIEYESHNGQLSLKGNHCVHRKKRDMMAERRRSQMTSDGADNEEEEEDDELQPPVPKKSNSGNSPETLPKSSTFGNFPGPGLDHIKQEVIQKTSENSQYLEQKPETNEAFMKPMLTITTQLELLKSLEAIIGIMDLPINPSKIRNQIQKISAENGGEKLKEFKMEDIKTTINYAILVSKLDRRSEGETRSLKEFLKLVQFTVVKDRFEQIEKELKEELETLKTKDMLVPVSNITEALEAMVKILVSN